MFNIDNYNDWIDSLFKDLKLDDSDIEEEIWEMIRDEFTPPNIGNLKAQWLLRKIVKKADSLSSGINYSIYLNNMDTHLTLDYEEVTDIKSFKIVIENRNKELEKESNYEN